MQGKKLRSGLLQAALIPASLENEPVSHLADRVSLPNNPVASLSDGYSLLFVVTDIW